MLATRWISALSVVRGAIELDVGDISATWFAGNDGAVMAMFEVSGVECPQNGHSYGVRWCEQG